MRQYQVYALGNALVDYEFEVLVSELSRLGITKGVMTLIEESRHDELMGELQGHKHKRACGGSAANALIGLSQLGAKTFYSCKVAADEAGDFYFDDLRSNGVDTNLSLQTRDEGKTGKCLVMVTPDADRSMNTFLGITGAVGVNDIVETALAKSDYFYIEGYLASSESACAAVQLGKQIAKRNDVKIALSLSDPNMVKYFGKQLHEFVGDSVDLLFCNEAEAMAFTQTADAFAAAEQLRDYAVAFAITRGSHGALVFDGAHMFESASTPVTAVDTNGAGDMFAGAFMYGLSQGWDYRRSAQLANYSAGLVVADFGPRLSGSRLLALKEKAKQIAKSR